MIGYLHHCWNNIIHKFWVFYYILIFCTKMMWRAIFHDMSKFSMDEGLGFAKVVHRLKNCTYGSPEYKKLLEELDPFLALHYARNSHHPQFYKDGVNGMSVEDFVEMFCDWRAAVRKHADGNINRSIALNKNRFDISKQTSLLMMNSVNSPDDYRKQLNEPKPRPSEHKNVRGDTELCYVRCCRCEKYLTADKNGVVENKNENKIGALFSGVIFTSYGNYGSGKFDPLNPDEEAHLECYMCDECLVDKGADVQYASRLQNVKWSMVEQEEFEIKEAKKYREAFAVLKKRLGIDPDPRLCSVWGKLIGLDYTTDMIDIMQMDDPVKGDKFTFSLPSKKVAIKVLGSRDGYVLTGPDITPELQAEYNAKMEGWKIILAAPNGMVWKLKDGVLFNRVFSEIKSIGKATDA